jgi:hypothetical protein
LHAQAGDVDDDRFRLLGEDIQKGGPHARSGDGVEHPGQPDHRVGLSGDHQ